MKKLLFASMLLVSPLVAAQAHAKGGTPQNHHCVKDGNTVPDKTKKECTKEGGKWEKDAHAAKADDKPAAAAADKKPAADAK